jgi:putative inorganic carbon (hco3(-)) transporter
MTRIGRFILQYEIWAALILAAVSFMDPKYLPVALAGFFVIMGCRFLVHKRFSRRTSADLPILVILLMSIISFMISNDPVRTKEQVFRLWVGISLFYSINNWIESTPQLRSLVSVIIISGLCLAISTPFITLWNDKFIKLGFPLYSKLPIITNDPANPNVIAGSLLLFFLLCLGIIINSSNFLNSREKVIGIFTLSATGFLILMTQSRGAIISTLIGGSIILSLRIKRGWMIPFLFILAVIVVGIQGNGEQLVDFITGGSTISGIVGRIEIWSRAIFMIEDYPYTGIGMGLFGPVADTLYPFHEYSTFTVEHAHNIFLQLGVDLGIPGLISWMAVLELSVMAAALITIRAREHWLRGLGAGLLAIQIAIIVHGLTDSVLWGMVRPSPLVWVFWGLVFSTYQLMMRDVNDEIH